MLQQVPLILGQLMLPLEMTVHRPVMMEVLLQLLLFLDIQ